MTLYQAYGLVIDSELEIPEFPLAPVQTEAADLAIRWGGEYPQVPGDIADQPFAINLSDTHALFYRRDQMIFQVHEGRTVKVSRFPGVELGLIRAYLVGLIMALVLYQRGQLVLHASVVTLREQAVGFMAASGSGKSSLATALHLRGWGFFNDDVAPLRCIDSPIRVSPGFPQVKLTKASALSLGQDLDALLPLHSAEEKRGLRMQGPLHKDLPLRCIFVIHVGDQLQISDRLSPSQALHELLLQTLPTRFRVQGNPGHLQNCAKVASQIPFYHLQRTRDLSQLPALVDMVEQHLAQVHRISRWAPVGSGMADGNLDLTS